LKGPIQKLKNIIEGKTSRLSNEIFAKRKIKVQKIFCMFCKKINNTNQILNNNKIKMNLEKYYPFQTRFICFKVQTRTGFVAESLADGKKNYCKFKNVSLLSEISILYL
jgi:hypothetical protein